jgi:putative transposase
MRLRWNRFGSMLAAGIRRKRVERQSLPRWCWHLDEMIVKINSERHYLWWAVDHEGEVLESYSAKKRDMKAALKFFKKTMRRHVGRKCSSQTN